MKELKIGDRVACYYSTESNAYRLTGVIASFSHDDVVFVDLDSRKPENRCLHAFKPQQLRRLVKKKRREWWIELRKDNRKVQVISEDKIIPTGSPSLEIVRVREVKEK